MLKSVLFRATVFLALLVGCSEVYARDLGVIGKVYEVTEEDLIEYMQRKMREAQENGVVDEANRQLKESSMGYLSSPPGVTLPRVKEYGFHEFDPTFVLDHDIVDANGNLLHPIGTRVNPLEYVNLNRALCFIDGADPDQVAWGLTYCGSPLKAKLILVNGPLGDLMKAHPDTRFYFDQQAYLVRRLGITAVPSVARQSDHLLVVEEFPVEE